jgi:hypothetical protein
MRWVMVFLIAAVFAGAQQIPPFPDKTKPDPVRLPNGKLQTDEIVKSEHKQSLKDAEELKKLIGEFCDELEKADEFVVSVQTIRKLEEIEKRAKKIRNRMTRN